MLNELFIIIIIIIFTMSVDLIKILKDRFFFFFGEIKVMTL